MNDEADIDLAIHVDIFSFHEPFDSHFHNRPDSRQPQRQLSLFFDFSLISDFFDCC
jgi:hypothetical protein